MRSRVIMKLITADDIKVSLIDPKDLKSPFKECRLPRAGQIDPSCSFSKDRVRSLLENCEVVLGASPDTFLSQVTKNKREAPKNLAALIEMLQGVEKDSVPLSHKDIVALIQSNKELQLLSRRAKSIPDKINERMISMEIYTLRLCANYGFATRQRSLSEIIDCLLPIACYGVGSEVDLEKGFIRSFRNTPPTLKLALPNWGVRGQNFRAEPLMPSTLIRNVLSTIDLFEDDRPSPEAILNFLKIIVPADISFQLRAQGSDGNAGTAHLRVYRVLHAVQLLKMQQPELTLTDSVDRISSPDFDTNVREMDKKDSFKKQLEKLANSDKAHLQDLKKDIFWDFFKIDPSRERVASPEREADRGNYFTFEDAINFLASSAQTILSMKKVPDAETLLDLNHLASLLLAKLDGDSRQAIIDSKLRGLRLDEFPKLRDDGNAEDVLKVIREISTQLERLEDLQTHFTNKKIPGLEEFQLLVNSDLTILNRIRYIDNDDEFVRSFDPKRDGPILASWGKGAKDAIERYLNNPSLNVFFAKREVQKNQLAEAVEVLTKVGDRFVGEMFAANPTFDTLADLVRIREFGKGGFFKGARNTGKSVEWNNYEGRYQIGSSNDCPNQNIRVSDVAMDALLNQCRDANLSRDSIGLKIGLHKDALGRAIDTINAEVGAHRAARKWGLPTPPHSGGDTEETRSRWVDINVRLMLAKKGIFGDTFPRIGPHTSSQDILEELSDRQSGRSKPGLKSPWLSGDFPFPLQGVNSD